MRVLRREPAGRAPSRRAGSGAARGPLVECVERVRISSSFFICRSSFGHAFRDAGGGSANAGKNAPSSTMRLGFCLISAASQQARHQARGGRREGADLRADSKRRQVALADPPVYAVPKPAPRNVTECRLRRVAYPLLAKPRSPEDNLCVGGRLSERRLL
jgi:hypothetical protein